MRKLAVLGIALMIGVALLGCKKSSSKSTATPQPTTSAVSTPACIPDVIITPGFTPEATPTIGPPPTVTAQPTTTASGLQIFDLQAGTGAEANATSCVVVSYTGWLEDGTIFDSSAIEGGPLRMALGDFIPGFAEGAAGMKIGGKRRLIIPPELAYGAQGYAPTIPPNATLTFDVELVDIK